MIRILLHTVSVFLLYKKCRENIHIACVDNNIHVMQIQFMFTMTCIKDIKFASFVLHLDFLQS